MNALKMLSISRRIVRTSASRSCTGTTVTDTPATRAIALRPANMALPIMARPPGGRCVAPCLQPTSQFDIEFLYQLAAAAPAQCDEGWDGLHGRRERRPPRAIK